MRESSPKFLAEQGRENIEVINRESQPEIPPGNFQLNPQVIEGEINRLKQTATETMIGLEKVRSQLGLPVSAEEPPSVKYTREQIATLRVFSRRYHSPDYRRETADELQKSRKSGTADAVADRFYATTAAEKEKFESQSKERDIKEIMKDRDMVFLHSMPLESVPEGFAEYNRAVNADKIGFDDRYRIIEGAQPVISVSVPSPERADNGLFRRSGMVLGGGTILSAKKMNTFSVAHGLYKRTPGARDNENPTSSIQPEIDLDSVVVRTETPKGMQSVEDNNEITVENPEIAGLYYDLTPNDTPFDPNVSWMGGVGTPEERRERYESEKEQLNEKIKKEFEKIGAAAERMNVPFYAIKKSGDKIGKFKVEFAAAPGKSESYVEEVLRPKGREISQKYGRESQEFRDFINKEFNPATRNRDATPYTLTAVTAEQILESAPSISKEKKAEELKALIEKGVFTNPVTLKEAQQRLEELRN